MLPVNLSKPFRRAIRFCGRNAIALSLVFSAAIFVLLPGTARAQTDTGGLLGVVTDSSGATVRGATVEIKNEDTGLSQKEITKRDGAYNFTALKVGTYTVTASGSGFDTMQRTHVDVAIQAQVEINLSLKVGGANEVVTVSADQVTLQTQDASVGQVVSEEEINNLPLNGRNYTLLAQLAPGTTTTTYDNGHGETASGSFTANGMITVFNNYTLDGISNNNMTADFGNGNSFTLKPPPDGLSQFKVETANYSAEYGRSGGAIINAVTKSGQNRFFGDAWEYNRNAFFDAEDYFLKQAGLRRPKFNRNQYGFSFGGPIVRDHTFFFVDWEGTRVRQGQSYTSSVPTARERSSGFTDYSDLLSQCTPTSTNKCTQTDLLGRVTTIGQVFDPATTRYLSKGATDPITGLKTTAAGYVREPFSGNQVPLARISAVDAKLLSLFPAPNANNGSITNNYVSAPVLQQEGDSFDVRVDQNFAKDQIFARASYGTIPRYLPAPCDTLAQCGVSGTVGAESDVIFGAAIGYTHIINSRMVNELRIGYNRIHMDRVQPYGTTPGINQQYGIGGIPDAAPNGGLAQIKITGLSELGEHNNIPLNEIGSESVFNENISMERGKHSMRFGVSYERFKNALYSAQYPHGYFAFSGTYTDVPSGNTAGTGIAQFAIEPIASTVPGCTSINGRAGTTTDSCGSYDYVGGTNQIQGSPLSQQDYRRPYFGAYYTDTWKITSNFTATLGLRWEYFQVGTDHAGRAANFVPSFASGDGTSEYLIDDRSRNVPLAPSFKSLMQQEGVAIVYTANHQLMDVPEKNFAPRIGFAWQFHPTSVLRGGYGIAYAGIYARGDGYNPGDDYPFTFAVNLTSSNQGGIGADSSGAARAKPTQGPMEAGLSGVPLTPEDAIGYQISERGIQFHTHIPSVQAENLSLQQQLTGSTYIQIAYVATQSRHIESNIQSNQTDEILPTSFSVSPVSPSPTCNDTGLLHDRNPANPNPTVQDNKVYYDQYPCLPTKNYYQWLEGSNNYNSLQTKFEKLYTRGSSMILSYTWERLLGYGSDSNLFAATSYRAPLVPGFGMKGEYSNVGFESENVIHAGGMYALPYGYGQFFGARKGLLDTLFGGWKLTGIFTYQSGQPLTVACTKSYANSIGCDSVVNRTLLSSTHTTKQFFNPSAFSDPGAGSTPAYIGPTTPTVTDFTALGTKPNQVFGPVFHRGDLGIQKVFHLPGTNELQFRAETFNLTNTPNFGQPTNLTPTNASFAQITTTRDSPNDAREFQFALKYIFGTGHQE